MISEILFLIFLVVVLWLVIKAEYGWIIATISIFLLTIMGVGFFFANYLFDFVGETVRIWIVLSLFALLFLYLVLNKPVKNYFDRKREIEMFLCNIWVQNWIWDGVSGRWDGGKVSTLCSWLKSHKKSLFSYSLGDLQKYSGVVWITWNDEENVLPAPAVKQDQMRMGQMNPKHMIGKYYTDDKEA